MITSRTNEPPQVQYADQPQPLGNQQLTAAVLLGGFILIVMLFLPHPALDDLLQRYPEVLGVCLGAIWWWAFAFSAVGCLIFFGSTLILLVNLSWRVVRRPATRAA